MRGTAIQHSATQWASIASLPRPLAVGRSARAGDRFGTVLYFNLDSSRVTLQHGTGRKAYPVKDVQVYVRPAERMRT